MDFAIIETGGKQYKVVPGKTLTIEKLTTPVGGTVVFDAVLLVVEGENVQIGNPYVEGVRLELEVSAQIRDKKIRVLRFRAKSRHRRHRGHRQSITKVVLADTSQKQENKKIKAQATNKVVKSETKKKKLVIIKSAKKPSSKKTSKSV